MSLEETALLFLDEAEGSLAALSHAIWQRPELGLREEFAAQQIAEQLRCAGFAVETGIGGMETAFVASWGHGGPVVGLLGEYDALPGLSQKLAVAPDPVEAGAPGHGCGHNLLGVGALGAILAAKEAMAQDRIAGTLRYYGCPAEETLVGKVYMARAGVFDDLDAALTWHPGYVNSTWASLSVAMNSFKVNFHGTAAHAGGSPEAGRSALDGVQLMDVGVNYMREHIVQQARVHCVITHGGQAPNVVPPYAQVWYYVRAPNRPQVDQIYNWMLDIARGAALMSGTTFDVEFLTGCYDTLPNDILGDLLLQKLQRVGAPQFSAEEKALARRLQETFPPGAIEKTLQHHKMTREEIGDPLCEAILEPRDKGEVSGGSTDVGDVSYIAPTAQITTCCEALGTPGHSWQNTVAAGSSIGAKGMMLAARALALATLELMTRPDLRQAAQAEFAARTEGKRYVSPLPEGAMPQPAG